MKLLLSRHGNTFGPGDPVVWTGTSNDLPLVESGVEQAKALGGALKQSNFVPAAVFVSKLKRVHDYAQIALTEAQLDIMPIVDSRLLEIDYGTWTGLSNEEVESRFGLEELQAWNAKSVWPNKGNWQPGENSMISLVHAFAEDLLKQYQDQNVLVISSNGTLRYFLTLKYGLFERQVAKGEFKVKTGNTCQMHYSDSWELEFWNQKPMTWAGIRKKNGAV